MEASFDDRDRVRQAVDIVELAGSYLQLRREGNGYKALCPWHDDSRPSLQVSPSRQTFRCFVCNLGGDVFSFIMKMEGVSFPEAIRMLADRFGVSINQRGMSAADQEDKRLLYQAAAWAEQQYHDCLLTAPEAEHARQYLSQRGITAESLAKFRLGYAPDRWDWLLKRADGTRFTPAILEKIGLVGVSRSGNGYYERFKGRVLFSIRDTQSRPVALGGRVLPGTSDANHPAKYVNSPETPLFTKSNLLYGLDAARQSIGRSHAAVIMEGYTDCLVAHQCGFENALAVLGTAVGERHIQLLKRYGAERIVLVLDGDEAGRRRTDQVLELFIAQQVDLRILTLPNELDPCDFLLQQGSEPFQAMLDDAVDALEHKFRTAAGHLSSNSGTYESHRALEEVLGTIAKAPRLQGVVDSSLRLKEDQILHRLAQKCGVSEERIRERLVDLRRAAKRPEVFKSRPAPTITSENLHDDGLADESDEPLIPPTRRADLEPFEREFLEELLQDPAGAAWVREEIAIRDLPSPAAKRIYGKCCEMLNRGLEPTFNTLLLEIEESLKSLIVELDDEGRKKQPSADASRWQRLLVTFRRRQDDQQRRIHTATLAAGQINEAEELEILQRIIAGERNRQGISMPTDG